MNIIIGADFVPTKENEQYFINGSIEKVFDTKLINILKCSSVRIFNLECPLTNSEEKIDKTGPSYKAPPETICLYKKINVDLLCLANNHIMDYGAKGLESTITLLDDNHIQHVGAGLGVSCAGTPSVIETEKRRIAVFACAEHEFSICRNDQWGANPYDAFSSFNIVKEISQESDYVIVLYHGGKEHYQYPSPDLRETCRKFVDAGANLVVCQHSHCIGCEEKYHDGIIVYGQGNFLFGKRQRETWMESILVQVDDEYNVSYIPLRLSEDGSSISIANEYDSKRILDSFRKRSKMIMTDNYIEDEYSKFALKSIDFYLSILSGQESFAFKVANKCSFGFLRRMRNKKRYTKKQLLAIQNFIECEAHRELLIQGIKEEIRHR